jgi:hypothetical protein
MILAMNDLGCKRNVEGLGNRTGKRFFKVERNSGADPDIDPKDRSQ